MGFNTSPLAFHLHHLVSPDYTDAYAGLSLSITP